MLILARFWDPPVCKNCKYQKIRSCILVRLVTVNTCLVVKLQISICFDSMAMPRVRFARRRRKNCLVAKLNFSILVIVSERSKLEILSDDTPRSPNGEKCTLQLAQAIQMINIRHFSMDGWLFRMDGYAKRRFAHLVID